MATYNFVPGVPNPPDNPSDNVDNMRDNNDNFAAIWEEDHVGFNNNNGGTHKQQRYEAFGSPALLVGPVPANASTSYPGAGVADPNTAQNYFVNTKCSVPMSAIRAYGNFATPVPTVALQNFPYGNQFNLIGTGSVEVPNPFTKVIYTINFDPAILTGTSAGVFITFFEPPSGGFSYSLVSGVLTITIPNNAPNTKGFVVSIMIVQV